MARTKNRFNAVQIPEPATADIPAKQKKILSRCTLCQIVGGTEIKTVGVHSQPAEYFKRIYQG